MERTEKKVYQKTMYAAKYILLTATMSFIGWLYEVVLVRMQSGYWTNRGFMWLPFCPIYGCTLLAIYFFMGTPQEKRGILKKVKNPFLHTALYLVLAGLLPTLAELFVGLLFDKAFHTMLWSYEGMPFNYRGYICLTISLLWSVMIYAFMRFVFPLLKRLLFRMPGRLALILSAMLLIACTADVTIQFFQI